VSEPAPPARIALLLFGAPRVVLDGRAVALGSRKALALLAMLALDGASARARLAGLLWPDQNEAEARRNLRREVFRLRNAGVPIDDGESQSLALAEAFNCDALEATDMGGILLDGFDHVAGEAYADWLSAWRGRLAQRGRQETARAAAAHTERGEWRAALALHLAELDADPTNESAAQHALRMHAKLDERNAALALFARLESQLHQQLGLAPLAATRELVQRFGAAREAQPARAEATSMASPTPSPLPLPARAPFVGRDAERQAVLDAWQAGRTVFLAGPPGIGKSRLAAECAAAIGAVLFVGCRPDDAQVAYSSAVRALRALFDAAPDQELPDWVTRELTRLMPELGPPADKAEADPLGDEARMRLFEAYAQAWLRLAEGNFNVIVLDDWQFADAASLQLWAFVDARAQLGGEHPATPLRRLVAHRSGELAEASLALQRREVDAGLATLLSLDGLPLPEVQSLVQRLAGQSGAALFAQRLHGATAGNPLFMLETIRHLFDRQLLSVDPAGGWRTPFDAVTDDYAELPVPPSARATLLARVHALGADAARLLEAASLAGDHFDLGLLAGTAALDEADSVAALERAQASQILRSGDDGAYRFAHDLYRQCVADSLSPARRALVHGRLARNLATAGGAATRIARHFELARLDREAAPWFVQAGIDAARVFDFDMALAHYERALQLGLEPREAYTVHDRRLMLLHRLHRTDEQLQELALMAELARALGDSAAPYELATKRAVTLFNSGQVADALALARWVAAGAPTAALGARACYIAGASLMALGDDRAAMRELEAALARAQTVLPEWVPMICSYLCHVAVSGGALDAAQSHYEQGHGAAVALDRPLARADVLNAGYRIAEAVGERALAIERLEEANALSVGVGDVTLRINYLFNLITTLLNGGDVGAARARRAEVMALLVDKTDPKSGFIEHLSAGRLAWHDGQLGRAWQAFGLAHAAATAASDPKMQRSALFPRAQLAADCGCADLLGETLDMLARTGSHPPDRVVLVEQALQARRELMAGDAAGAIVRLRRATAAPRAPDPDWQENLELARVTLAHALAAQGDAAAMHEALVGLRFGPRLKAMGLEARLALGTLHGATADVSNLAAARAELAGGRLAPLDAAHLTQALAAHLRRHGHAAEAAQAQSACDQQLETLALTLPPDDADTRRLRETLLARRSG
jgi:DNA-binding SARP family transcriptional activator